jgi:D-alanyl-D-alanine carboxypeptidase/D-alanyl-D-alanine-endopeptidase (penicillin-binding protein 4)
VGSVRSARLAGALGSVTDAVQSGACLAVAVNGRRVISDNADSAFVPGSNAKLITSTVALETLGPDHRFTTEVHGTVTSGGVVDRLVLVGGGDPLLSTADYPASGLNVYPPTDITPVETLADRVAAKGVRSVRTLVLDASRFDSRVDAPGWVNAIARYDASPLSALMINDGYIGSSRARKPNSAVGAGQIFKRLLEERNVTVENVSLGTAPDLPLLTSIASVPLSTVVGEMLTTSDNNTAELVLKEIGKVAGTAGSTEAGVAVESSVLQKLGLPLAGLVLHDGSGLSDQDRVTCSLLVALLHHEGVDGALYKGLPIAGQTGTLHTYLKGTPAEGVMRAKTGTLAAARALSGFFPTKSGDTIEFSFLVNGSNAKHRAENLWDDLAKGFATYPQGPGADAVAPLPVAGA